MADPAAGFIRTGQFVAHPWLCDAMGHLTTRHYLGFFDDASYHLLAEAGYEPTADAAWGWADVRQEIEYKAEAPVGSLLEVASRITALGGASLTALHEMHNRATGALAATLVSKTVCFDLKARRSMPLPPAFRAQAAALFGLSASEG